MRSSPAKERSECQRRIRAKQFVYGWAANNIFHFRIWDGTLYVILYILVPVSITFISLRTLQKSLVVAGYCYFTIMISAANCFYDALGRWDKKKHIKNLKLLIILIASGIAFGYGFYQFLAISISQTLNFRKDEFLYLYLPAIAVALIDIWALISREIDFMIAVKDGGRCK